MPPTVQLPDGMFDGELIHAYNYPLGGERWLHCAYAKLTDGYRWFFKRGGKMVNSMWPERIATGLSRLGRFGCLPDYLYSVGRHCLLLERWLRVNLATPIQRLLALIHDAPECLGAGDQNTNLKRLIGHPIKSYEDDLTDFLLEDLFLNERIGLEDFAVVDKFDKHFGATETRLLNMDNGTKWSIPETDPVYLFLQANGLYDVASADTRDEWLVAFKNAWNDMNDTCLAG